MASRRRGPKLERVARDCLARRTRMLSRYITRLYDHELRPHGLNSGQMALLVVTALLDPARPGDLARELQLDASTVSRNLERMRARGWLRVVPGEGDAREQPVRVTAAGRRLVEEAAPSWERAQRRAGSLLDQQARTVLREVTDRISSPAAS